MFKGFWEWLLQLLGIKMSETNEKQHRENSKYNDNYEDTERINFASIFANKLSNLALSDSTVSVEGDNKRGYLINDAVIRLWEKMKKTTARTLGSGGCVIVPRVANGRIEFDMASQDRLNIISKNGDVITNALILAEVTEENRQKYFRWANYTLEGTTAYIKNIVTNAQGSRAYLEKWADIPDIAISNVDKELFAFLKSPVDNRQTSDFYGVPITYGCKSIIDEIFECLEQIKTEFELKRVRLQADERTFKKDKNGKPIIKDDLFMAVHNADEKNIFNVFDPAIRDSSYYNRLTNLFELLEKQIGTSKGILTVPETRGATATEIKASLYDTYSIVCHTRDAIAEFVRHFAYICDVLANYYNLSPSGDYEVSFSWSYMFIESSTESFSQMRELQSIGAMSRAELRSWVTSEDIEVAKKMVEEIKRNEPSLKDLIGIE